jgi:hypothetical protein
MSDQTSAPSGAVPVTAANPEPGYTFKISPAPKPGAFWVFVSPTGSNKRISVDFKSTDTGSLSLGDGTYTVELDFMSVTPATTFGLTISDKNGKQLTILDGGGKNTKTLTTPALQSMGSVTGQITLPQ